MTMHFYCWSLPPRFIAVAQASSVAEARKLVLEQVGHGDGSCPERDFAAKWINEQTPGIWHGPAAEFALTDSSELIEMLAWMERKDKRILELENELTALKGVTQ